MAKKEKSSFILYHDIRSPLELLQDDQRGQLFLAILDYSEFGTIPQFDGALQMAFAFIKTALDRDAQAWESKRESRREAGSKGGKQTAANRANAIFAKQIEQGQANQAVPVPVPVPAPAPAPDKERKADKSPSAPRFTPPTVEEVGAYCRERGNSVDAQQFVDFYSTNGWVQGKGKPIRDWKACVRTWERDDNNFRDGNSKKSRSYDYEGDDTL